MIAEIQSFIDDSSPKSSFDPSCLILFPPSSPPSPPPPDFVRHYLHRLARDAQADATDRACSSILAGQGSESDDTGDIALWLGPNNHSTPDLVLKSLGLSEWAANGEVDRVRALRHIPLGILKRPITPLSTQSLRPEFQQVKEIADTIRTKHVQEALRAARDSLEGDMSDLNPNFRRENRRRRRGLSPESPEPYVVEEERTTSLFPENDLHPLKFEGLSNYILEFNRTHESRLHLWRRTRGDDQATTVLRYVCPDVVTAYMNLLVGVQGRLMIESVATIGPREQKSPHSQSDYVVYRNLEQQIARMLQSLPDVAVQSVVTASERSTRLLNAGRSRYGNTKIGTPILYSALFGVYKYSKSGELTFGFAMASDHYHHHHNSAEHPLDIVDNAVHTADLLVPPPNVVVSANNIIHVLGYTPSEGEPGTPITVRIHFHPGFSEEIYVRLVIGRKPVPTTVREIQDAPYGRWQLDAIAPPFDHSVSSSSPKAPLSVQALNKDNTILDTAVFGEFSYWAPGLLSPLSLEPSHTTLILDPSSSSASREIPAIASTSATNKKPKLHIETSIRRPSLSSVSRRRGASNLPTPSPTSPTRLRSSSASKTEVHLHRRTKLESVMRPKGAKGDSNIQTPLLQLITPLSTICENWNPNENAVGRRLVRFSKVQDGRRLVVSCEPITPDEYRETDSVISCIYRDENRTCYVTSVDIIFLLERLTNSDFPVEEKNRIRRNLEGLRPTTVSKHKHGFEEFFQRIMEFPDPKPRNIEKDLKVFEWSLLDQALEKILSKYVCAFSFSSSDMPFTSLIQTIDTSTLPIDDPDSASSAEPSPSSGSEDADYEHPHHPSSRVKAEGEPFIVEPPLPTPLQDEYSSYLNSSDGSGSLCSPLHGTASGPYSFYTADGGIPPDAGASGSSHWHDYNNKSVDTNPFDQFPQYEVTNSNTVISYPEVDLGTSYESFSYHNTVEPWS
ncbi:hypothetical protein H0H93_010224 [Arthromyces matolae]|nr:hypothetical protein H0H93_010224 [Arthromyces matolae]